MVSPNERNHRRVFTKMKEMNSNHLCILRGRHQSCRPPRGHQSSTCGRTLSLLHESEIAGPRVSPHVVLTASDHATRATCSRASSSSSSCCSASHIAPGALSSCLHQPLDTVTGRSNCSTGTTRAISPWELVGIPTSSDYNRQEHSRRGVLSSARRAKEFSMLINLFFFF